VDGSVGMPDMISPRSLLIFFDLFSILDFNNISHQTK
jgi:hypothetical protein